MALRQRYFFIFCFFHAPFISPFIPLPFQTPWKGCIWFRTCTPEKHSPVGHLSTDGDGSNLPIQGDRYRPPSISGAPASTGQRDDTSWWRTWSDFKGGWTVWIMERCNAACSATPFHCQQLHSGNMHKHQDNPGNTFLYMKPCVGDLSAWVSDLEESDGHEIWAYKEMMNAISHVQSHMIQYKSLATFFEVYNVIKICLIEVLIELCPHFWGFTLVLFHGIADIIICHFVFPFAVHTGVGKTAWTPFSRRRRFGFRRSRCTCLCSLWKKMVW